MSLVRFVHSADLHLDSPFQGLAAIQPDIAARLQRATFDAYDNIIALCIEEQVDALLVAGDVFDGADRSLRAQHRFVDGLKRLDDAGVRSFICHGNHDPLDGWEAKLDFPSGAVRFGPEAEGAPVFPDEPDRAVVYGMSYPVRDVRENLIPRFGKPGGERFSIGLVHANVGTNTGHEAYAPCALGDLEAAGFDYWALGHVHTREVLRQANPTVVYPGNPQGRHPNERDARGVYLVEVADSGAVRAVFHPVDVVRWTSLEVRIDAAVDYQDLEDRLDGEIGEVRQAADGRDLILRLTLSGRGPVHADLVRPGLLDDLRSHLNQSWSTRRPFAYIERVTDSTSASVDREERKQAEDFIGDLLRLVDEHRRDPAKAEDLGTELEPLFASARASKYLRDAAPSTEQVIGLLAAAEGVCLDMLLGDES